MFLVSCLVAFQVTVFYKTDEGMKVKYRDREVLVTSPVLDSTDNAYLVNAGPYFTRLKVKAADKVWTPKTSCEVISSGGSLQIGK